MKEITIAIAKKLGADIHNILYQPSKTEGLWFSMFRVGISIERLKNLKSELDTNYLILADDSPKEYSDYAVIIARANTLNLVIKRVSGQYITLNYWISDLKKNPVTCIIIAADGRSVSVRLGLSIDPNFSLLTFTTDIPSTRSN